MKKLLPLFSLIFTFNCAEFEPSPLKTNILKTNIDGYFNEKTIIERATKNERVTGLDYEVPDFINEYYHFLKEETKREVGLELPSLDNLSLIIRDEATEVCPTKPACYSHPDTIYMDDEFSFRFFFATLFHEIGHFISPNTKEYFARAFEIYSLLKLPFFSPELAKLFAPDLEAYSRHPLESYGYESSLYFPYAGQHLTPEEILKTIKPENIPPIEKELSRLDTSDDLLFSLYHSFFHQPHILEYYQNFPEHLKFWQDLFNEKVK